MKVSFSRLARKEPKLYALLGEALAVKGNEKGFCANRIWYKQLKPRLVQLVGWSRKDNELLRSPQAYDEAYQTIYDALPDCKHEGWCLY